MKYKVPSTKYGVAANLPAAAYFFLLAKTHRGLPRRIAGRKEIVVHLLALVSNLLALASPLPLLGPHSLPLKTLPSSSKNSFQSTCRKDG